MATFYQYLAAFFLSLLQTAYIFYKGYFLSIEFTLYPYLVKNGFIPYQNIYDQHFPSLFFGTFSLPLLARTSPLPLLILLLSLLLVTNLLLFHYLHVKKVANPHLWLTVYVVLISYFSANTLWVETFINLLIVTCLNLSTSKWKITPFFIGLIFSQIVLMRPTLIFSIFLLWIFLKKVNQSAVLGFFSGIALSAGYLIYHHNFSAFVELAFKFNTAVYANSATILPSLRQVFSIGLLLAVLFLGTLKSHQWLIFLISLVSLLAAFPRFGLEHLQPFVLFLLLGLSENKLSKPVSYFLILFFGVQIYAGLMSHRYGNYFYSPSVMTLASKISSLPGKEIYLFGASDLLYPLANKLPPEKTYIPSLPWYLNYPKFQKVLYSALESSNAPVLVDTEFSIDGKKLISTSPQIYEYIKMNYNLVEAKGNFELYLKKYENSY